MTSRPRRRRRPARPRWQARSPRSIWARSTATWRVWPNPRDGSFEGRVLSRVVIALGLAAAVVSGAAVAFLRTDFVANNLCAYAVATIEEATQAQVRVSRCSVQPEQGMLTIEGLRVGDPGGRIDLKVARG